MRGRDDRPEGLFSYVRLEERIPADHPLRAIRVLTDEALGVLNKRFEGLYSSMGRPSIAPFPRPPWLRVNTRPSSPGSWAAR